MGIKNMYKLKKLILRYNDGIYIGAFENLNDIEYLDLNRNT